MTQRYSIRLRFAGLWASTILLWFAFHQRFKTIHDSGVLRNLRKFWGMMSGQFSLHLGYPGEWFVQHNVLAPAVLIAATAYVGCLIGLWWCRVSRRQLFFWAAACGLPFLLAARFHSSDIWDYLLRARMEFVYGLNPFRYSAHFMPFDEVFGSISWPQVRWVYGPLYLLIAAPFALIRQPVFAALLLRMATFAFHLINGVLLWNAVPGDRRQKVFFTGAYLLSPLLLIESAINAHNDFFMICLILLAILADRQGKIAWASLALFAAVLIKLYAVPVLACFLAARSGRSLRGFIKTVLPGACLAVATYGPFWYGRGMLSAPFDGGSSRLLVHSLLWVVSAATPLELTVLIRFGLLLTISFIFFGVLTSFRTGQWERAAAYTLFAWCTMSSGWYWPWYAAAPVALAFAGGDRALRWGSLTLLITDLAFYLEPTSWRQPHGAALSVTMLIFFIPLSVIAVTRRIGNESLMARLYRDATGFEKRQRRVPRETDWQNEPELPSLNEAEKVPERV